MRSETKREKKPLSQELIMSIAHKQMEEKGTAGLSLRAIARELGVTAPAIYNYFPRLEDLITALITNAFTDLAEAMEYSREQNTEKSRIFQIKAMIYAYRQWAVDHPVDFQLIYGNPIPGYQAPFEVTGPLARQPFLSIFRLFAEALERSELEIPPEYRQVPEMISAHLTEWRKESGLEIADSLVCLIMSGWARIHGLVMLELFHHIQPVIGDPGELYKYEIEAFFERVGINNGSQM